jgi:hypothetical protein
MKIYQLYFKPEQTELLDSAFIPYDNTENTRPELREWYIWDKEYENCKQEGLDYWGFVSWKFGEKTGIDGQQFVDFINANPGFDLYFINPCLVNEAVFINSWEQGDLHHQGISDIGNSFLQKIGYENIDVKSYILDRTMTMFANYIVGSAEFWEKFMTFSRKLFTEAESDPEFYNSVFGEGGSNYNADPSLPMFTFLIERLIPIFIELESIKSIPFAYNADNLPEKYKPYAEELTALSNLKVLINVYKDDELFYAWNYYRQKFLTTTPGILGLE